LRKKRFGQTLFTEEEAKVLEVFIRLKSISKVAKELGKSLPTVSIVKKRIDEKIAMAIETLRFVMELGYISFDEIQKRLFIAKPVAPIPRGASDANATLLHTLDMYCRSFANKDCKTLLLSDPETLRNILMKVYGSLSGAEVAVKVLLRSASEIRFCKSVDVLAKLFLEDSNKFLKELMFCSET